MEGVSGNHNGKKLPPLREIKQAVMLGGQWVKKGDVFTARVTSVRPVGAFVEVMGNRSVRGLVPLRQLQAHPLTEGAVVKVEVARCEKVTLGRGAERVEVYFDFRGAVEAKSEAATGSFPQFLRMIKVGGEKVFVAAVPGRGQVAVPERLSAVDLQKAKEFQLQPTTQSMLVEGERFAVWVEATFRDEFLPLLFTAVSGKRSFALGKVSCLRVEPSTRLATFLLRAGEPIPASGSRGYWPSGVLRDVRRGVNWGEYRRAHGSELLVGVESAKVVFGAWAAGIDKPKELLEYLARYPLNAALVAKA